MQTVIYYFTGTGNSLETARLISQKLGNTQLISIAGLDLAEIQNCEAERIGIIFPVYMWGLPLIVARFAEKLRVAKNAYIFSVATYGGMSGAAQVQLQKILRANNLELSGSFNIKMPGNFLPLYDSPNRKALEKIITQAGAAAHKAAEKIEQGLKTRIRTKTPLIRLSQLLYNLGTKSIPGEDKNFTVTDSCNSCEICARICPARNIHLQNGRPSWLHRCEQCLACLHWCPQAAIQYGKKTAKRRRYHHPAINVLDIEKSK